MEVGDRVEYVPHECHAMDQDHKGDYPWEMGIRKHTARPGGRAGGPERSGTDDVEKLEGQRLQKHMAYLRRAPAAEREKLVLLRPTSTWPATVRKVNEDGTVNLDVKSPKGGVTLHYDGVEVDDGGTTPHSCKPIEKTERAERATQVPTERATQVPTERATQVPTEHALQEGGEE